MVRTLKGLYHWVVAVFSTYYFGFPSRKLTIVGVTGTDGKTTTTSLIYHILKKNKIKASMITSVHAVIGGHEYDTGFHVTTPNAFYIQKYLREALDQGDTHVVLEVTSHGLSQHRVTGVHFDVGVITNVTHEHLDWHKTFEKYRAVKISLLTRSKVAVINRDEAALYDAAIEKVRRKKVISYGVRRDALVNPKSFPFKSPLVGEFNTYNCLAAIAACYGLGLPKEQILAALPSFSGVKGRMETVQETPFRVVVDFAHTPNALVQVLKTMRKKTRKRLIHVFGAAGLRDQSKRPLMGKASGEYADIIILTEEDYRTEDVNTIVSEIASGIAPSKEVYREYDRAAAIEKALMLARPHDTVIITGKGHEKSLCRGTTEYPWSDQEEVKKVLKRLGRKSLS